MTPRQLKELINEGESTVLEFKRKLSSPQKIAREIASFANTKGGTLLVGVDDNGDIYGIESEKEEIETIELACEFEIFPSVVPEIEIINIYDKDVLAITIYESLTKPHLIYIEEDGKKIRRAYIRVGEQTLMASREMYRLLSEMSPKSRPLKIAIGDREKRLFDYLEVHTRCTVKDFANLVNISDRRAERLLISLVRAKVIQIHNDSSHDYFTLL
ncbi:MAG: ATP-binding protein [Candidatus Kapabacteria bacterium]|nr:ATP-binding protein [Candidatus Kapabacteria bacterium]